MAKGKDLRIIGGKFKRAKLLGPSRGMKVRPISDSAKEMIFNTLRTNYHSADQQPVYTGRVADIFCGTGSLGLEALSYGAKEVTFVDRSILSLALVTSNLKKLNAVGTCVRQDVQRLGKARQTYDLIFLDPPFDFGLASTSLKKLLVNGWITEQTICVLRISYKEQLVVPEQMKVLQEKSKAGRIIFLRCEKGATLTACNKIEL